MLISFAGSPYPPTFTITSVTSKAVIITANKMNNPGASPIRKYLFCLNGSSKTRCEDEDLEIAWNKLDPNTKYQVWIVAFNVHGNTTSPKQSVTTDVPSNYLL